MNLNLAWVVDPKEKEPSVSLTNFVLSTVFLLTMGTLQVTGVVESTGVAVEYFAISSALYFGRRIQFNGTKTVQTEENKEVK